MITRLIWLTDLHLEQTSSVVRDQFFKRIRQCNGDAGVITGDISSSKTLPKHLSFLARAFAPRPLFFVLGNHEYFGSSFAETDYQITRICKRDDGRNLRPLGHGEIVQMGVNDALIGHRGWADGRAGFGHRTRIPSRDFDAISDFQNLSQTAQFRLMATLGQKSANYFYHVIRRAVPNYETIWVATHVPPFNSAVRFNGRVCGRSFLPHFCNFATGQVLLKLAHEFPKCKFNVLAGHTHVSAEVKITPNLMVLVGGASARQPTIQKCFQIPAE